VIGKFQICPCWIMVSTMTKMKRTWNIAFRWRCRLVPGATASMSVVPGSRFAMMSLLTARFNLNRYVRQTHRRRGKQDKKRRRGKVVNLAGILGHNTSRVSPGCRFILGPTHVSAFKLRMSGPTGCKNFCLATACTGRR
jgi:hypothetical protein